jgi:hypothetical protein
VPGRHQIVTVVSTGGDCSRPDVVLMPDGLGDAEARRPSERDRNGRAAGLVPDDVAVAVDLGDLEHDGTVEPLEGAVDRPLDVGREHTVAEEPLDHVADVPRAADHAAVVAHERQAHLGVQAAVVHHSVVALAVLLDEHQREHAGVAGELQQEGLELSAGELVDSQRGRLDSDGRVLKRTSARNSHIVGHVLLPKG